MSTLKILLRMACGFLVLLFLTQCAAKPGVVVKRDEPEILGSRVREFWDLQINVNAKNAEKIYQYEAPAYREKVSYAEYVNRFKLIRYLEADVKQIEIEGNKGKVTVISTYQMVFPEMRGKKLTNMEPENWVKVEGAWYHIPKAFDLPAQ